MASETSTTLAQFRGIDLRALTWASLGTIPLLTWPFFSALGDGQFVWTALEGFLSELYGSAPYGLGLVGLLLVMASLWRGDSPTPSKATYWSAATTLAAFVGSLHILNLGFWYLSDPNGMARAIEEHPDWLINPMLNVTSLVASIFFGGWLYTRLVNPDRSDLDHRRFWVLAAIGLAVPLAGIANEFFLWAVEEGGRPPYLLMIETPGGGVATTTTLVLSLILSLGRVLLFGLPAIAILKRYNLEKSLSSVLTGGLIAGFSVWACDFLFAYLDAITQVGASEAWSQAKVAWRTQGFAVLGAAFTGAACSVVYWWVLDPPHAKSWVQAKIAELHKSPMWQPSLRRQTDDGDTGQ